MTSLTLAASSIDTELNGEAERYLAMLDMKRNRLAEYATAMSIVRAHNHTNGRRLLDVTKRGFNGFRRAYGKSLGWIVGDYSTSNVADVIAKNAGNALRAFFRNDPDSGVVVMERFPDENGILLYRRELCGNPSNLLDENHTLLLPTGISSPRLDGAMLYERIDLGISYDRHTQFSVRDVLFTGDDGESIAGIGDVSDMYIKGLRDLLPTLYDILGESYNLANINARIFSAVQYHERYDAAADEITVAISEEVDGAPFLSVVFVRQNSRVWTVNILFAGRSYPLAAVAPKRRFSIHAKSVATSRRNLVEAFKGLESLDGAIDIDSVFAPEHIERLPLAFRKEYERDHASAKQKFLLRANESLARFKANPRHWKLIHFSGGRERQLTLNGASAATDIQLCVPLYLTEEDERFCRASVYAVAELSADGVCHIPSILDSKMAIGDINNLIRGVRHGLETAA